MKLYQVDAFTKTVFAGNPAAVVPLDTWINDKLLQYIATENNLAETAFIVPKHESWEIRWFTPVAEVALCGHATLAAAHVLIQHQGCTQELIEFHTRESGVLTVARQQDQSLAMSFPAIPTDMSNRIDAIGLALGSTPASALVGSYSQDQKDYVAVFNSEKELAALTPNFPKFQALDSRGVIATAPGTSCDFVSRYFGPNFGINEDPVTGSAHCLLTPYWSNVLGKQEMQARQISKRGGELTCAMTNDGRVLISGHAVDYLIGDINFIQHS